MKFNYIIITPAKNESVFIRNTINSIINQTIKPERWLIVDDGSNDDTYSIASEYADNHNWISVVKKNTLEKRAPGANVVHAFNYGLGIIKEDFDFLVKLDADLEISDNYFEILLNEFENDSLLGIAGGYISELNKNKKVIDKTPEYHVRGAMKMYRKKCFQDIGGLVPQMGWDGIDEIKAMMHGWKTKSFRNLVVTHLRPTGKETGLLKYAWRWGKSNYYMGYNSIFLFLSCVKKFSKKPYVLFGLTIYAGYLYSLISRSERINDKDFISFIRRFQLERIKGLRLT